jgi:hypothetical protein
MFRHSRAWGEGSAGGGGGVMLVGEREGRESDIDRWMVWDRGKGNSDRDSAVGC